MNRSRKLLLLGIAILIAIAGMSALVKSCSEDPTMIDDTVLYEGARREALRRTDNAVSQNYSDAERILSKLQAYGVDSIDTMVLSPDKTIVVVDARYPERWTDLARLVSVPAGDLYIFNTASSDIRRLTTGRTSSSPAWSPDGNFLAYSNRGSIVVMTIASGDTRNISAMTLQIEHVSPDASVIWSGAQWSPNGLAIAACGRNSGRGWVAVVNATDGNAIYDDHGPETTDLVGIRWNVDNSLFIYDNNGQSKTVSWASIWRQ